jgi:hypothetical protein
VLQVAKKQEVEELAKRVPEKMQTKSKKIKLQSERGAVRNKR